MNILKPTYIALCSLILGAVSCSKEESPIVVPSAAGLPVITFRTLLPESGSRADIIDTQSFSKCSVTCFHRDAENPGIPYFECQEFLKHGEKFYPSYAPACVWPEEGGFLDFLAFYPPIGKLKETAGDADCNIVNASAVENGELNLHYSIDSIHIARDISRQVDFIKAYACDSLSDDSEQSVELDFRHQLSRVEINLYRSQRNYNFQVAGVRLGNPAVVGKFTFCKDDTTDPWALPENPFGKVEYVYQPGDQVKTITSHTKEDAVPLMDICGPAMVIPTRNGAWGGKSDPLLQNAGNTMYFSILINVTLADPDSDGTQIFPAKGISDTDQVKTVSFAVNKNTGVISARYDEADGKFHADGEEYDLSADDEVRQFAWAAVPIAVDWKRGKKYVYTLNYSSGVGVRDPESPRPGDPVIGGNVGISVSYVEWTEQSNDIDIPEWFGFDDSNE